jgi:hypothetical protein
VKREFCYGQIVRVVGADWSFRACGTVFDFESLAFIVAEESRSGPRWWPEYLLESAE